MATERRSMRQTREILRQKWRLGRTHREVAQSLRISTGAVGTTVLRARAAGLDWALAADVGDPTPNGYRREITCPCGVTFERWVTELDAIEDLLREHLRAERN